MQNINQFEQLWNTYINKLQRLDELKLNGRYGYQLRMPKKAIKIAYNNLKTFCEENNIKCPV